MVRVFGQRQAKKISKIYALAALLSVLPVSVHAELPMPTAAFANIFAAKPKFLPVHEAFVVTPTVQGQTIRLDFKITPKHYIYQDRLSVQLPSGVVADEWQFSLTPTRVDDPIFGQVSVFEQNVVAATTLTNQSDSPIDGEMIITWQGCAKAGLCYPPEKIPLKLSLPASLDISKAVSDNKTAVALQNSAQNNIQTDLTLSDLSNDISAKPSNSPSLANTALDDDVQAADVQILNTQTVYSLNHTPTSRHQDAFGLLDRPLVAVLLLFLAGIVLAFSACVYPMIPIVANIVAKSHSPSAARGFWLTLAYGLGVATSYGMLGLLVAWFGQSLGIIGWLQNPWILSSFALVFVLLACHMMGLWHFSLPSAIKSRLAAGSQAADHYLGSVGGSFVVGVLSALVVSPCVSAPLAGALLAVSMAGDAVLGFVALFALGLGLSLPLVVMGTVQGKWMPKAGAWMNDIKFFGGLMLLFVALLLVSRLLFGSLLLILWAAWFVLMGLFLWRLGRLPLQALSLLSLLWAGCLMVGAAQSNQDPWRPLQRSHAILNTATNTLPDVRVTNLAQLDDILKKTPKAIVEVTAQWCIECHIMERTLFTNRPEAMMDWQLIRLDITDTTTDSRQILQRYQLFGPPALLYYNQGQLQHIQLGEVKRQDFEQALATF